MSQGLLHFKYKFELKPGEKFQPPAGLVELLGPGRWIITVKPAPYDPFITSEDEDEDDSVDEYVRRKREDEIPF
jgi:hypothetical protein